MSVLRIARSVYDAVRAHSEETYPEECCGALLGCADADGWRIEAAVKASNARAEAARSRYEIAPAELVKIEREARARGCSIAGFYHSHPDHPARWSATDFAEAHWLGCCYVITSVTRGRAAETHSFLLAGATEEEKRFERETIEVIDANKIEANKIEANKSVKAGAESPKRAFSS